MTPSNPPSRRSHLKQNQDSHASRCKNCTSVQEAIRAAFNSMESHGETSNSALASADNVATARQQTEIPLPEPTISSPENIVHAKTHPCTPSTRAQLIITHRGGSQQFPATTRRPAPPPSARLHKTHNLASLLIAINCNIKTTCDVFVRKKPSGDPEIRPPTNRRFHARSVLQTNSCSPHPSVK